MNAIDIKDLTVNYRVEGGGYVHALSNVSLSIPAGSSIAVVGESGCGKTTLASSVMRLLALNAETSGSIKVNGKEVTAMTNKELENIRGIEAGIIFQDPMASLNPLFSVKEQIEETIQNHLKIRDKIRLKEMALKLLEETGIKEALRVYNSYPHQLSGGQQQRVMIAIALSCSPGVLIADEPTTALDVTVQAQIIELLKGLKKQRGLALMLITHDLHLALELCERIVVMYAGEIVEDGNIRNKEDAGHPYTRALFEIIPDINEKKREFVVIPGEVPDMKTKEDKCYFYGRCLRGRDECASKHPLLEGEGHMYRCYYPLEGKSFKPKAKSQK